MNNLFTKTSSHQNVSIIFITQNLFHKGKGDSQNSTLYKNTHLLVLFDSPLDTSTVSTVARRMSDSNSKPLRDMMLAIARQY